MPSRKQRKRRAKDKRHEYEYVYIDAEGRELEVDEQPVVSTNGKAAVAIGDKDKRKPRAQARGGRSGRVVEPASWRRAVRRGLIFMPFMFGILYLLNGDDVPLAGIAFNTLVLLAFFVPFGYMMDKVMHRAFVRRTGGAGAEPAAKKKR